MKPIALAVFFLPLALPVHAQKKPAAPKAPPVRQSHLGEFKLDYANGYSTIESPPSGEGIIWTFVANKTGAPISLTAPGRALRGRKIVVTFTARFELKKAVLDDDVFVRLEQPAPATPKSIVVNCTHATVNSDPKSGSSRIDFVGKPANINIIYTDALPPIESTNESGWIELDNIKKLESGWKLHLNSGQIQSKKEPS